MAAVGGKPLKATGSAAVDWGWDFNENESISRSIITGDKDLSLATKEMMINIIFDNIKLPEATYSKLLKTSSTEHFKKMLYEVVQDLTEKKIIYETTE